MVAWISATIGKQRSAEDLTLAERQRVQVQSPHQGHWAPPYKRRRPHAPSIFFPKAFRRRRCRPVDLAIMVTETTSPYSCLGTLVPPRFLQSHRQQSVRHSPKRLAEYRFDINRLTRFDSHYSYWQSFDLTTTDSLASQTAISYR
jgi:hypothetical protein